MTALCLSMIEQQARAVSSALGVQHDDGCVIVIPGLHIKNGCNLREHWRVRAKRVKNERSKVGWALVLMARPELPCVVTITRIGKGFLDAHDNLPSGCKGIVDEIAAWLGVNDNDPRVTWRYAQEKAKGYAARIQIEGAK